MAGEAAALLDELMGRTRNEIPGKEVHEMDWSDVEVCKSYLCGFCPCDLFTNTRADIGTCDKVHDEKLRSKYQESGRAWKMGYEVQFLSELEKIIRSLDRRITHGKERLRRSAEAKQKQMAGFHEDGGSDKLRNLNKEINSRVMQLEELGQRGEVEGAQVMLREVEALEKDRERERAGLLRDSSKTLAGFEVDANDFHEKMELCDVCGSFLVIGDSQSRVDAHLLGKQHLGYARIRAAITDVKTKLSEMKSAEMESRPQSDASGGRRVSQEQSRQRSRSRERRQRSRSSSRNRYHSRDQHQSTSRKRHHSRSRRRSQRDKRSYSRERRSHSRGRDRGRVRRSRSRDRDRDRERRSRSRDRERSSRSRDRDRSRKRRSRSRDGERRSRSRDRDRSRKRRSRSRGGERRSRSRDGERRSRSRDRDRSRKRRSRSRDRDRGRERRSRSRDREKNGASNSSNATSQLAEK